MLMIFLAQTPKLNLQDIVRQLLPTEKYLLFDIFLYIIFFLGLIAMFMQSDKQMGPTLMLAAVAGIAVISKLHAFGDKNLATLLLNALMLILPLIVTGITKAKKSQPLTIIGGVLAGVYFFLFWILFQRG
jgi:hypothetical protein